MKLDLLENYPRGSLNVKYFPLEFILFFLTVNTEEVKEKVYFQLPFSFCVFAWHFDQSFIFFLDFS